MSQNTTTTATAIFTGARLVDDETASVHRGAVEGRDRLVAARRLADPEVVAVLTGQQVGLFGGPALTLYKALGAVATARALGRASRRPVAPGPGDPRALAHSACSAPP